MRGKQETAVGHSYRAARFHVLRNSWEKQGERDLWIARLN